MTKINLVKYGFVRWPEKDFSDDGNRFTCYKAGKNIRVSKHVSNGDIYLSIDSTVGKGTLPFEIYHTLPHYDAALWKYNGVSIESLTDDDLENFMAACLAYELEYEAAEANIKYPTLEEIQDKAIKLTTKALLELTEIKNLFSKYAVEAAVKFSLYEWKTVQEYLGYLAENVKKFDPETFPPTIIGQQHSFNFVKPDYNMHESHYFKYLKDLFAKYGMN